ncbi:MAG: anthranilate phosphoribosyltransferase, partial [SAR324 cluster bacterium]|nr:anthranilate phosphoribosyltransferase [SAR324 cluster bacterium]
MKELLAKLLERKNLSQEEAREMILWVMSEEAVPTQAAALLALLQAKGATIDEIVGAAHAMRERSEKIKAPSDAIDTCSTGGNGISTFNISTCAALIAAAGGAVVAKHGNRSNTRRSGSAEALQALGVNIDLDLSQVEACLQELQLCFCYAIKHHPAMRFAGPIRRELGIPTVFNILGPLTNPAQAQCQLVGVPNVEWTFRIAQVLAELGAERALVVHGADGLCELTTTAKTHVAELRDGKVEL